MATRKKNEEMKDEATSNNGEVKTRKRPERMGPDFFDSLLDYVEKTALARAELERVGKELEEERKRPDRAPGKEEALTLQIVGAARRLDVAVSDGRARLRGTTFTGIAIERFKARLEQAEQSSRNGWALVEDRF
jgi:hypothetical protein